MHHHFTCQDIKTVLSYTCVRYYISGSHGFLFPGKMHSNNQQPNKKMKSNLHQSISVNPHSLGRKSLRQRLEAYYSLISPDALSDQAEWDRKFDLIYEKYGGTEKGEKALATKLCKKYGTAVRLRLITKDGDSSKAANEVSNVAKKEESWYNLSQNQRNSGVIDFISVNFDPDAALACNSSKIHEMHPFVQNAPILDNVSKFVSYLPECDPLYRISNRINAQKRNNSPTNKKPRKLPIFTSIASKYENNGPLSLLYNTHIKKQRIRIMIRYNDCIRSTLTGYLLAFDKHMNMILRDVDEVYTSRVTKAFHDKDYTKSELEYKRRTCIVDGSVKRDSRSNDKIGEPKLIVKQRHFHQLLVRGDNVVMVWRSSTERSAWPKTIISPKGSQYQKTTVTSKNDEESARKDPVGTPGSLLLSLQSKHCSTRKR